VNEQFDQERVGEYLAMVVEDILDNLDQFREAEEATEQEQATAEKVHEYPKRYAANVLVHHSQKKGPPVIWETTPSYRNLFGTVDKSRSANGEWETDHTRIKAGSLLRADGGFLVLDAIDVLVEPGVWAALKRTLRHRQVEIQSFDPAFLVGASIKPEPVSVDVKVLMIGTRQIYRVLYALDEDFKKIFKVKAEFAMQTPISTEEIGNYACLIHKRCEVDGLLPFHRGAVAAIVEHGVRLAGHQEKLTTRFTEVSDVIRESGYWAARDGASRVEAEHVRRAVRKRAYRVNLVEEVLRERIADGTVLLDLTDEKVAQVNGLAVLDVGDHEFGLPSRITAATAMGRAGIIDIDRESEMSGSIHTKGVLILTGFLRERFAQNKPLALTASVTFEQNYGGVDGDSASSAELYALLSSLSGAPIRQGIAVTGSVNQRGEVQPIGGVNEKIEGYFDLCRLVGFSGGQGVMIPRRNLPQLMLRPEVVEHVRDGRFHVWAVSTIEEGLEVLTGLAAGARGGDGHYPPDTVFGRADAELTRLAEEVGRFGPADHES
jgi:lon-related putative ATP-dependent protease